MIKKTNSIEPVNGNFKQIEESSPQAIEHILQHLDSKLKRLDALLSVIEINANELKEPMTVILGLSCLLLAEVDANSELTRDLTTITKQIKRMSEIIKSINQLMIRT